MSVNREQHGTAEEARKGYDKTDWGVVAFVIERRLLKALKTGSVKPAARTAAGPDEPGIVPGDESQPRAEFSPGSA